MRGRTQPGQGHLALLMQDAQERMQAAAVTLPCWAASASGTSASGIPAGAHWEFTLTPRNVRDIRTGGVALAPLAEYPSWLESARALHEKQPVTCARGGDASFLTVLQSWRAGAICGFAGRHVRGLLRAGGGKTAAAAGAGAAGCGAAAGLCGGPGTAYGVAGVRVQLYRGSGRSLPILPLWRNRAFVCQTQLPRFPLGGCGPRRNGAAAHFMTIRRF